jgi:tetratricopeptide (TPR) repeat protein
LLVIARHACGQDAAISFFENRVQKDPDDFVAQNQLASRYLDELRLTGDNSWLEKARRAAEASTTVGLPELNTGGLFTLGRVQIASHQFAAARDTARKLRDLVPRKAFPLSLLGDALFELGDYGEAARAYQDFAKAEPNTVDSESRLAKLALIRGELDAAREHLDAAWKAAHNLTPRDPAVEAWSLVQLGQLAFSRGDWVEADKKYEVALAVVADFWSAVEHVAELRGAQGKYPEAIALYQKLITRLPRPELMQALGDLYAYMGNPGEAKPWYERAGSAYRKEVEEGKMIYDHHLAGFYSDSVENPVEAVKWARKDLEMRHSISAHDAIAWALYRDGQFAEAGSEMKKALALGMRDAHLFFHASMIATANGNVAQGKQFLQRAAEVNPRYNAFHVHR